MDLVVTDVDNKAASLAARLREFFSLREGTGQFCAIDAHRLPDGYCFIAYIADRLQLLDGFTDEGEHTLQRLRPALPLTFVYYPDEGIILLKSRLRAEERILDLVQCFGRIVLGIDLDEGCLGNLFDLDRLKRGFHPLPDSEDMELIRVKALHLRYPQRAGGRHLKLETVAADAVSAIPDLLSAHFGGEGILDQLQVSYAQLQVRLRVEGRSKSYILHLWPNRCTLSQTPLGKRFRSCLKRWGLLHVR